MHSSTFFPAEYLWEYCIMRSDKMIKIVWWIIKYKENNNSLYIKTYERDCVTDYIQYSPALLWIFKLWLTHRHGCESSGKPKGATSQIWLRRHKRAHWSWSEGWPARATPPPQRFALLRCGSAYRAWCHNLTFNREYIERGGVMVSAILVEAGMNDQREKSELVDLKPSRCWPWLWMTLRNSNETHWHIGWSNQSKNK